MGDMTVSALTGYAFVYFLYLTTPFSSCLSETIGSGVLNMWVRASQRCFKRNLKDHEMINGIRQN